MPNTAKSNGDSLRTLDRAFSLMEALVELDHASLATLASATGLHKSTAHRFLATMIHHGWAAVDSSTEGYHLGPQFLALCARALAGSDLRGVAAPYLEELRDLTEESANLGAYQEGHIVCLASVPSRHSLRMSFEPGHQSPFHATAIGKAIAAHWSPEKLNHVLERSAPLKRYTPTTVSDPERLRPHLQRIREQGYSVDDMELTDQVRCVAAPVFGPDGHVVGAVSVSGPAFRMTLDRLPEVASAVMQATQAISARLGYRRNNAEEAVKP